MVSSIAGLLDDDLLQPARQRPVALDVLELLERRRTDDTEVAGSEHRLDQRGEIERAARRGAGADRRVDLVDEENRIRPLGERRMTALKRSSKSPRKRVPASSAVVSSEYTSAPASGPGRRPRAAASPGLQPSPSCRRRGRRRTPDCSCAGGRGSRASAAAPSPAR